MFFLENARAERPHNVSSLGQAKPFLQTDKNDNNKVFFFSRGKFCMEELSHLGSTPSFIHLTKWV